MVSVRLRPGRAIDAAAQLNTTFLRGGDLVAEVLGESSVTLGEFLVTYERDVLPPRELAKATLDLYAVRFKQIRADFAERPIDQITIRMVAEFLEPLTPRASNQARAILIDLFNHAAAKGLCPDNPAANTIPKIEKKQRKRHTLEGLKAIRDKSPRWLKNAIDLALITAQRRGDILDMKFEDVRDGYLYVVQSKTEKASDAGWLKIKVTDQLGEVLSRCRTTFCLRTWCTDAQSGRRNVKGRITGRRSMRGFSLEPSRMREMPLAAIETSKRKRCQGFMKCAPSPCTYTSGPGKTARKLPGTPLRG